MTTQEMLSLAEDIKQMTTVQDIAIALTELYYKGKSEAHSDVIKTLETISGVMQ